MVSLRGVLRVSSCLCLLSNGSRGRVQDSGFMALDLLWLLGLSARLEGPNESSLSCSPQLKCLNETEELSPENEL